jgi:hypothetical protein
VRWLGSVQVLARIATFDAGREMPEERSEWVTALTAGPKVRIASTFAPAIASQTRLDLLRSP